ncbi:phosphotransferase [Fibrobacter sp. UWB5]|uniref:phosphotransferase n=1 Tax=Fibrobacter sp. UWB5 TaxID=1964360 RepID=UPI0013034007|nr:phosphotransferase [Fibrobacter sp. UWB5]
MIEDISRKRWFMGKGRQIRSIEKLDSIPIGGTKVSIIQVLFESGERDYYCVIEDESKIGAVLAEYFGPNFPKETLLHARPLNAEQSNSAFYSKGEFFFKLYRRLQVGEHPEAEIMKHLSQKAAQGLPKIAPDFYGDFSYTKDGETRTLGILEEHVPDAQNAWDLMVRTPNEKAQTGSQNFFADAAFELGRTTAQMHKALKDLEGTPAQAEEVPFDKLIGLLKANGKENLIARVESIRSQQVRGDNAGTHALQPQRIHGDYHLGQLLYKDGKFIVLDFEGEPTRTLEYRRRLRSPAADIAGMLRSFAYASAVRGDKEFEQVTAEAFLQGYSRESGISVAQLKEEASPYVLGKAIYEACYELEFRPDWFWIPERALKSGL